MLRSSIVSGRAWHSGRQARLNPNGTACKVKQLSQRWATLVHAYIACPTAFEEQIKSGTMQLPGIPESGDGLNPAEAGFVSVIQ